jgi:hypothetical protein
MNTAASVASQKEKHPEQYCPAKRCLWRTGGGACPRHTISPVRELAAVCETIAVLHATGSQDLQRLLELEYRRRELQIAIAGSHSESHFPGNPCTPRCAGWKGGAA